MERITSTHLEILAKRINEIKGTPKKSWIVENGKNKSLVGNYHIDGAYGGVSLHCMANECGGINDVLGCGHISKRDLWNRMRAFLEGCRKD